MRRVGRDVFRAAGFAFLVLFLTGGCASTAPRQEEPHVLMAEPLFLTPGDDMELRIQKFMAMHPFPTEADKIAYLLSSIRDSHCIFVRNGSEFPSGAAANWLRWKKTHKQFRDAPIVTAWDFVHRVATRSVNSGRPYEVILTGGVCLPTRDVLRNELDALEDALREKEQNKVLLDAAHAEGETVSLAAASRVSAASLEVEAAGEDPLTVEVPGPVPGTEPEERAGAGELAFPAE